MTRSLPLALLAATLLAACADSPSPLEPTAVDAVRAPLQPQRALVAGSLTHELLAPPANAYMPVQEVQAINAGGWVVGTTRGYFDGVTWYEMRRATLWKQGTAISLGPFDPAFPSRPTWAHDVNDAGVVVGYGLQSNATGTGGAYRAFRWVEGQGYALLPDLPGATGRTVAEAIDAQGRIVGWTDLGADERHVLLWTDPAQPPVDLGGMGAAYAVPTDMNDAGQITGWRWAGGVVESFLREPDGTVHVLPQPGARASAVNAHGVVVGQVLTDDGAQRAFRWSTSLGFELLGAPAGGTGNAAAIGVDDIGRIVGAAEYADASGERWHRAVLWAEGSWIALGDAGFAGAVAVDVNESGQVAGAPTWPSPDQSHAIRWTVTLVDDAPRFTFTGFFPPVDDAPAVNQVRAGSAVPVKFSLGGDHGLAVLAAGYPLSQPIACDAGAPTLSVEETVTAGSSVLQYDATTGQYVYVWKTQKTWAGSCRRLVVRLVDGTERHADFAFTR